MIPLELWIMWLFLLGGDCVWFLSVGLLSIANHHPGGMMEDIMYVMGKEVVDDACLAGCETECDGRS